MQGAVTDGAAYVKGHEPDLSSFGEIDDKVKKMAAAIIKTNCVWNMLKEPKFVFKRATLASMFKLICVLMNMNMSKNGGDPQKRYAPFTADSCQEAA